MATTLYYLLEQPPSRAVLLTLKYAKIDINLKVIDRRNMEPDFLQKNPQKIAPLLYESGLHITSPQAITQYLLETKAPESPLLGHTVRERALLSDRLYFESFLLYRFRSILAPILRGLGSTVPEEKVSDLRESLQVLDTMLEKGDWVAVLDRPTLADLHILPSISSLKNYSNVLSKFSHIEEWYERCKELPGFEENEAGAKQQKEMIRVKKSDFIIEL